MSAQAALMAGTALLSLRKKKGGGGSSSRSNVTVNVAQTAPGPRRGAQGRPRAAPGPPVALLGALALAALLATR